MNEGPPDWDAPADDWKMYFWAVTDAGGKFEAAWEESYHVCGRTALKAAEAEPRLRLAETERRAILGGLNGTASEGWDELFALLGSGHVSPDCLRALVQLIENDAFARRGRAKSPSDHFTTRDISNRVALWKAILRDAYPKRGSGRSDPYLEKAIDLVSTEAPEGKYGSTPQYREKISEAMNHGRGGGTPKRKALALLYARVLLAEPLD